MSKECKGTVAQVQGPVIDVQFPQGELPSIQDALWLEAGGQRRVMEVAQHVGRDTVRCFMLSPSEGIGRGMEVRSMGGPISVPVGEKVLGRMFNVLGDPIDGKGDVDAQERWSIHRQPPSFADQRPVVDLFETGIKVIDLLAPTPGAARSACSAAPGWARRCSSRSSSTTSPPSTAATPSSPAWGSAPGRAATCGGR